MSVVGFTLTHEQKARIDAMQKRGDTAGAHAELMRLLHDALTAPPTDEDLAE